MDYYTRMAGTMTLYAALLQQSSVPHFTPPSEAMSVRPIVNPLGAKAAWRWLARFLNQKPQRVSCTVLLAFLKPVAHALTQVCPRVQTQLTSSCHADGFSLQVYPRQFPKLLRLARSSFVSKVHSLIDAVEDAAEERAALSNLETWLDATLKELNAGRALTEPPEADMPVFKEPDNTADAGDDSW